MNLLIGTSHLRLSLRVERRQAPSYLDLPQDQELLNLFLRPSPFTHTNIEQVRCGGVVVRHTLHTEIPCYLMDDAVNLGPSIFQTRPTRKPEEIKGLL